MQDKLIKQLLKIYKRKSKSMILFVVVFLILTAAYSLVCPYEFNSTASLFPPKQSQSGGGLSSFLQNMSFGGLSSIGGVGQSSQGKVFAEILVSRTVAEHIINSCKLHEKKQYQLENEEQLILEIQNSINVTVDKSGIIYITTKAKSPYFIFGDEKRATAQLSRDMAAAAINALDSILKHQVQDAAKISLKYSQKILDDYRQTLDSIENELQKFQEQNKVLSIEDQPKALIQQQIELGVELAKAETELQALKSEYADNSTIIQQAKSKIDFLRQKYNQAQQGGMFYGDKFSIPFDEMPHLERAYTILYRDKEIYEQVLLYLETQRHQSAIQEAQNVSQVEILDPPNLPAVQSAPARKFMVILAFIISSSIALLYIAFKSRFKGELILSKNIEE